MKKVISVSMVVAILFAFTACSSAEYVDTPVTVAVTDEDGKEVTDKDGKVVTEVVSEGNSSTAGNNTTAASDSKKDSNSSTAAKNENSTTKASSDKTEEGTTNTVDKTTTATTAKNETTATTKVTTTEKPTEKSKKRDITITVNLPYYNEQKTELTLFYKVDGDKKYTTLETREVTLDSSNKKEIFKIKNVKGDVLVYAEFKDITATHNSITIPAGSKDVKETITPVTGMEIMDGGEWG